MNCVLPTVRPSKDLQNYRLFFSSLSKYSSRLVLSLWILLYRHYKPRSFKSSLGDITCWNTGILSWEDSPINGRECSSEILKRIPKRYQDPVLWAWLDFFTPKSYQFWTNKLEWFSFECRKVIGFAITTLRDWLKKLAPLFHPIRSKTKTNRKSLARVFPRFASATCNYFEFWLVHCIVCVFFDWLEWLLWFWFCDTQLKTVLTDAFIIFDSDEDDCFECLRLVQLSLK